MLVSLLDARTVPGLAAALRHVSITGVFYCPSFLSEPWALTLPAMPGCAWFHVVTSGHCRLSVGTDHREVHTGDLVLVPHGTGHLMAGGEPVDAHNVLDLPHEEVAENYAVLRYGGGGRRTELVCGGLRLEHPIARRVVDALPSIVHVPSTRSRRSASAARRSTCWPTRRAPRRPGATR